MGWGRPKELVKTHGNTELEMGRGCPRERKWVEDAQGKKNGPRMLEEEEMGQGAHEQCNGSKKPQSGMNMNPITILGHCN